MLAGDEQQIGEAHAGRADRDPNGARLDRRGCHLVMDEVVDAAEPSSDDSTHCQSFPPGAAAGSAASDARPCGCHTRADRMNSMQPRAKLQTIAPRHTTRAAVLQELVVPSNPQTIGGEGGGGRDMRVQDMRLNLMPIHPYRQFA